ncbi:MAG: hypothetical protein NTV86_04080 [Planctomycetota bacterium]|nr:hypothetical protein [Planctomycetota bacterium]
MTALALFPLGCGEHKGEERGAPKQEVYTIGDITQTVTPPEDLCMPAYNIGKNGEETWLSRKQREASYLEFHRRAWCYTIEDLLASKTPGPYPLQGWPADTAANMAGVKLAMRQFEAARTKYGVTKARELAAKALKEMLGK